MGKRVDNNIIIDRIKNIHGDKYKFDKFNYTSYKDNVILVCNRHGDFSIKVSNLLSNKRGCTKCGVEQSQKSCLSNIDAFIIKANIKHHNTYDYSKSIYINWKTPLIIICTKHGDFEKTPNEHLNGSGCLKCKYEQRELLSKTKSLNKERIKFDIIKKNNTIKLNNFISLSNSLHQKKYDYSLVEYVSINKKVKIKCRIHGIFEQTPHHHKNGNGCPECYYQNSIGRIKLNTSDFISKSNKKHSNYYIYDKTIYNGHRKNVIITCPIHGDFEQLPYYHSIGGGCKHCSIGGSGSKNSGKNKGNFKYTNTDFIEKCNEKHDNLYNYSKTIFNGVKENIIVICEKHGDFKINAFNHREGQGCSNCSMDSKSMSIDSFYEKSFKIHQNKYTYFIDTNIVKSLDKININCKEHGDFIQTTDSHLRGSGCNLCKTKSRGEIFIMNFLIDNKIKYIREKTFNNMRNLRFDFYLIDKNMCIEYDGKHHYEPIEYFGGIETFEKVKINDSIKNKFCKDNNIELLRISYKDIKNIENILKNKLFYDKLKT